MVTMVTDPIADMLTRIRNAVAVGHERVAMPSSKIKVGIAQILMDEGFIDRFEVKDGGHRHELELVLRYGPRRRPVIEGVKRISKPGHRVYRGAKELPRVQGGLGVAVVSTSQGLLPDREARRRRLGGEVVCEVW
jgi:small subunit ribosomal protein S8